MTSHEQIPEELWLDIFHRLPLKTLKDVSVTEHAFRRICLPLLFADFRFYPYTIDYDGSIVPPTTEIQLYLEHEIAPLVRSCHLTAHQSWRGDDTLTDTSPYILLASFFVSLPSFIGLRRLDARGIHFTQTGLTNLCRLPILSDLRIDHCDLAAGESIDAASLELRVSRFSLSHGIMHKKGSVDHWIQLLCPDRLRELEVSDDPRFFGQTVDAIPSFPHVHKLSAMSQNLSILSKFPAVQILALNDSEMTEDVVRVDASAVLPVLREYTGPCETLPIFLAHSTLARLIVPRCDPATFIAQLPGIQVQITSLNVTFWDLDTTAFRTLCAFFPSLTELCIRVVYGGVFQGYNSKAKEFFSELGDTPTLPSALERLAFAWEFEYEDSSDEETPWVHEMDSFDPVRDALVIQCPALTTLWLDGDEYLFRWHKSPDGTEDQEHAGYEYGDVSRVRRLFSDFWRRE
ncbi:hypothetical protein B0H11DRAFT_2080039 [Mycena galericulata]|nr:hypothetical protein B0H11DRAFT_2080039 [Mycena galericulata]